MFDRLIVQSTPEHRREVLNQVPPEWKELVRASGALLAGKEPNKEPKNMLQEFVALEKTIEQALGVQLKSTQELSGRPESDIKRFDGKLTLLYEVTNPKYDEQLKFAFRAWVDERASGQVFAITLYDNVVAGKRLSRDLVYRNTLYLPYGPIQPHTWSVLLEQLNAWMQRSATQSLPDVKSGKELSF